jgi:hypothetical protein
MPQTDPNSIDTSMYAEVDTENNSSSLGMTMNTMKKWKK